MHYIVKATLKIAHQVLQYIHNKSYLLFFFYFFPPITYYFHYFPNQFYLFIYSISLIKSKIQLHYTKSRFGK